MTSDESKTSTVIVATWNMTIILFDLKFRIPWQAFINDSNAQECRTLAHHHMHAYSMAHCV